MLLLARATWKRNPCRSAGCTVRPGKLATLEKPFLESLRSELLDLQSPVSPSPLER